MVPASPDPCPVPPSNPDPGCPVPCTAEGQLVSEVKWAGYDDREFQLVPFIDLLARYALHDSFLEHLTFWYDHACGQKERDKIFKHVIQLPMVRAPPLSLFALLTVNPNAIH